MRFYLAIILSAFLVADCIAQKPKQMHGLAIVNVNIINVAMPNDFSPDQTVLILGNKITRIGDSKKLKVPPGFTVIDGKDKFLIPGLWDMHTHLSYYGAEAFPLLLKNGVTTVRDMGGDLAQIDQWREDIKSGKMLGPKIYRAGPFVDGPKKMDAQRQSYTKVVETAEQGKQVVDELKKLKVDFIKIHSRVPREAFFAIAEEARKQNIPLMVHAPKDVTVAEISKAGARSVEHTESLLGAAIYEDDAKLRDQLTDEALKKLETDSVFSILKKNKTFYDPTLISLYLLKKSEYDNKVAVRLLPMITKLYKARVTLLTGTDFAWKEAGIVPGKDLHGELELFVKAGLTPLEALKAATINAAWCMGVEREAGSITQGKIANVVLLDANPLKDIANTKKISKVIVNGKLVNN